MNEQANLDASVMTFLPRPFLNALILMALGVVLYGAGLAYDRLFPTLGRTVSTALPLASDFTVTTLDGQTVRLADFRGRVVILNFWATWCPPCVVEFPTLIRLAQKYQGRVVFLALSSDKSQETVKRFLTKVAKDHDLSLDPASVVVAIDPDRHITRDLFKVRNYPESLIITPDGRIARHIIGIEAWEEPETTVLIEELLEP